MSTLTANTTVATSVGAPVSRRSRFFLVMAVVLFLPVVIGFGPTFFLRPWSGAKDPLGGPFPVHLIIHGSVLSAWYLVFIAQTALVAARRVDVHRRLGVIGVGLAVAVVVASGVTTVRMVPRATALGTPASDIITVAVANAVNLIFFASFVAAAVYLRRRVAAHKRLMFLASNQIIGPAFSGSRPVVRTLVHWFGNSAEFAGIVFILACLGALVVYDVKTRKRIHPATVVGIVGFFVSVGVVFIALASGLGAAFVEWLR